MYSGETGGEGRTSEIICISTAVRSQWRDGKSIDAEKAPAGTVFMHNFKQTSNGGFFHSLFAKLGLNCVWSKSMDTFLMVWHLLSSIKYSSQWFSFEVSDNQQTALVRKFGLELKFGSNYWITSSESRIVYKFVTKWYHLSARSARWKWDTEEVGEGGHRRRRRGWRRLKLM